MVSLVAPLIAQNDSRVPQCARMRCPKLHKHKNILCYVSRLKISALIDNILLLGVSLLGLILTDRWCSQV